MRHSYVRALAPIMTVAALGAVGCDKAKSALEEASGFSMLDDEQVAELLAQAGWDEAASPNLANFKIHGGFELSDKFPGDLGKDVDIPVPFDLPEQAEGTAENQRSMALLRKKVVKFGDQEYTRFQIVTVARYDAGEKKLVIDDALVGQAMDDDQKVGKDTDEGQTGQYLIVEGKGSTGLAYLEGTVKLKKQGAEGEAVKGAAVFTSSSPFVTISGSTGKYFLAMLDGSKGQVMSYKSDIASAYSAPNTPPSSTTDIPYAGALSKYEDKASDKAEAIPSLTDDAKAGFAKANNTITDACTKYGIPGCSWTLVEANLVHVQPQQAAATPATPPAGTAPAAPSNTPPAAPAPTEPIMQRDRDVADADVPHVDLSCSTNSLVYDGSKFDDAATKGWRFSGDVRITTEKHASIFGDVAALAAASNYPDTAAGYCLLTTGDQLLKSTAGSPSIYNPGPDGAGRTSEMWQKVGVPGTAKSIQVRVAFFSQEFPKFVGTQFNDSFFIKFDESPEFIAAGNLNDLAGAADAALAESVANCRNNTGTSFTCGEWKFVGATPALKGDQWVISASTQAPRNGKTYGCTDDASKPCFHGMIAPRIICKNIDATTEAGKTLTLRMGVSDAGDSLFDSALAVDTIAFSSDVCGAGDATRLTPAETDPDSRANLL